MENDFLKNKIEQVEIAVKNDTLIEGFYMWLAENEKDKEKSAQWKVKADQTRMSKKFNEDFLEYAKTL